MTLRGFRAVDRLVGAGAGQVSLRMPGSQFL